jgi:hypothetical protein
MPPAYHATAGLPANAEEIAGNRAHRALSRLHPSHWHLPRGAQLTLLTLLALLPVSYMIMRAVQASSNIVYWDEFDTALGLVLRLDQGMTVTQFFRELFAVNNEHRMVTSRLLFATNYWLTGTVSFKVISVIGNSCLLGLCAVLIAHVGTAARRIRLGLILAFVLFQLAHYENFLWSGSSIDHFQVVLLAGGALVALARGTRGGLLLAGLLGLLATFTLAQGLAVWPVGAFLLWRARRRPHLAAWCTLAALVVAGFFAGFRVNPGHRVGLLSLDGIDEVIHYWLTLVGMPVALGSTVLAPWLGAALLGLLGWLLPRGIERRETVAFHFTLFCLLALALITYGRAGVAHGVVYSRYLVLGSFVWALTAFMLLGRFSHPRHPLRLLAWSLPVLMGFNFTANLIFADQADTWVECRDRAAARFKQYGADGYGPFTLSPTPKHSTELLKEASRRGLYYLPRVSVRKDFSSPHPTNRISYFVDEMTADTHGIYVSGWAAIPGAISKRGQIHLVLRSASNFIVYSTMSERRPDVVKAYSDPAWQLSGFRFAVGRWRLPPEELQVGILITDGDRSEYMMTDHRLRPYGRGEALLATGQ